ncbi:hypothetical protein BD408DRAFT_407104 [Parasitella parasitica]|nr:hypothetical protein BD408DRAFT_407104 [Parasitella parasitica]
MGGVRTIFFGDIAQLLPVRKNESTIWRTAVFNTVNRYDLIEPVRQKDPEFVRILNKVRLGYFDEDVVVFMNERTVLKRNLPLNCLRLYTTREAVDKTNKKDMKEFPDEGIHISAIVDNFVGTAAIAKRVLSKETRLPQELILKIGMPVMLIQNLNVSLAWVNGAIATVFEVDEDNIGLKKFANNDEEDEEETYWIQRISRQASDLFLFGAPIPLAMSRKYGVDVEAINISRGIMGDGDQDE